MDLDALLEGLDKDSELSDKLKSIILENIEDEEFLMQVVIHPNSPDKLRKLGISNIHDDKFLFEQAIKPFPKALQPPGYYGSMVLSTSIKKAAVHQIKSERILKKVVLEPHVDGAVNDAAIKKISDEDFHKAIVLESSIGQAKTAVWQITDKEFLEDLILDRSKHSYRNAISKSLIDRLEFLNRN